GGKGPLYEYYKQNNYHNNVQLLGFVDDDVLWELYNKSDVFIFPTQFEGMPTVILEAMSYSMPIIVSNVGATLDLVDDKNGYILNNKKDSRELADIIFKFISLTLQQKQELSFNSYLKVKENYTWEIVSQKTLNIINE